MVAANRYRDAEHLLADVTALHVAFADHFLPARRQVRSDEQKKGLDRERSCWKGGCRPRVRSRPRRVLVFGLVEGLAFPLQMGRKIHLTDCVR